jgi:3-oxoacyl-[acyl-carrier protein] reductase
MKTSIRTHEGRVALVTGAGQGIGQAIAFRIGRVNLGRGHYYQDLVAPIPTVRPTIFGAFVRRTSLP